LQFEKDKINMEQNSSKKIWENVLDIVPKETIEIGPYFTNAIKNDIRHLMIALARYKFAARIIGDNPKKDVLELGCNEGLGTLCLAQVAAKTVAVDFDKKAIKWAKKNFSNSGLEYIYEDFLGKNFGKFDAVVSIDVIEHIEEKKEQLFVTTIAENLKDSGVSIVGTPNITASLYASEGSKVGHINLYDSQRLKELFLKNFKNVFLFGMNDEVVHTGFMPMAHYLFVVACNKR
jgi:2-polyprenyl-3-methyl-5-hydroxy-6-metoxy-1,4-benzoquinol methylase